MLPEFGEGVADFPIRLVARTDHRKTGSAECGETWKDVKNVESCKDRIGLDQQESAEAPRVGLDCPVVGTASVGETREPPTALGNSGRTMPHGRRLYRQRSRFHSHL